MIDNADRQQAASPPDHQDNLCSALLSHLVAERPTLLSFDELVRQFNRGPLSFEANDSVRAALGELSADGLVHNIGDFYFATHAAARSKQLRL